MDNNTDLCFAFDCWVLGAALRMSSEMAVVKGSRFLSNGLATKPRFSAAMTTLPTPLHNSTTSKSLSKVAYSGLASTLQDNGKHLARLSFGLTHAKHAHE